MLGPLLSGGLSLLGGLSAQQAAKKTQKLNIATSQFKLLHDAAEHKAAREKNEQIAKQLEKSKEKTTEHTVGGTTQSVTEAGFSQNSVDIAGMMAAAEAAGFNPISFLRNGGLQAYMRNDYGRQVVQDDWTDMTVTTTRQGHNAAAAAQLRYRQPHLMNEPTITHVPGVGEAVANAGKAAFNTWNDDRIRQETQDFQWDLMNRQLAAVPGGYQGSRSFYVPGFATAGPTVRSGTQGGLSGAPSAWEPGQVTVTNPYKTGRVDPGYADAESFEARYAEPGSWLFGVRNLVGDASLNVTGMTAAERAAYSKNLIGTRWGAVVDWFGGLSPAATAVPEATGGATGSW